MLYGGNSSCDYGCLGFGDCAAACAFGAITIKDGIAHVNKDLCTGCEACTAVCPKHIIEMMPENQKVKVACSSKAMPKAAMQSCKVSCIACKKCERSCEFDAIHVNDFLAKIDPEKCTACGKCVEACPNNMFYSSFLLKKKRSKRKLINKKSHSKTEWDFIIYLINHKIHCFQSLLIIFLLSIIILFYKIFNYYSPLPV